MMTDDIHDRSATARRPAGLSNLLHIWDLLLLEHESRRTAFEEQKEKPYGISSFRLLAAAAGDLVLDGVRLRDEIGACEITVREEEDRIFLTFQASGQEGWIRWPGRPAWVISEDGLLRERIAFDVQGTAELVLRNTPGIRESVRGILLMPSSTNPVGGEG